MLDFEFLSEFATEAVFRELVLLRSGRKHNSSLIAVQPSPSLLLLKGADGGGGKCKLRTKTSLSQRMTERRPEVPQFAHKTVTLTKND